MEKHEPIPGLEDVAVYIESYKKDGKCRVRIRRVDNDKIVGDYVSQNLIDIMVKMNKKAHRNGFHPIFSLAKLKTT